MSFDPRHSISISAENINKSGFRLSGYGARGEKLWKTVKSGPEYTQSIYGIFKILIMGLSFSAFICLIITVGHNLHHARYTCFLTSTSLTFLTNALIFAMSRFRIWNAKKPSLPHQMERINGFVFVIWNFVSSGLIAPVPQKHSSPGPMGTPCLQNIPAEICTSRTTMACILGFGLSIALVGNFFLAVWWGPPLRYSMRLKNLTQGDKYVNFTGDEQLREEDEDLQ